MGECSNCVEEANIAYTLAVNAVYQQIKIDQCYRLETVFTGHYGLHKSFLAPFSLDTAPMALQQAMNVVIFSLKWPSAFMYLDDIEGFFKNFNDDMTHLWRVLILLRQVEITLRLKKSSSCVENVNLLAHFIWSGWLKLSKAIAAVMR